MHFIVLSDIHLNRPNAPSFSARNKKENDRFDSIVSWLLNIWPSHRPNQPALLFTGDIVHTAHRGDFALVKRPFEKLKNAGFDMLVCPGNHDVDIDGVAHKKEALKWWMDDIMRPFHRPLDERDLSDVDFDDAYPVFDEIGDTLYVGMDSSRGPFSRGEIGDDQLQDAVTGIEASTVPWKVAYFHHHPFEHTDPTLLMVDADKVMAELSRIVDVIVFGHKHHWGVWSDVGINTLPNVPAGGRLKLIIASHKCTNSHQGGIRVVDVRSRNQQLIVSKPPAA